jgi:phage recombination protein Bet
MTTAIELSQEKLAITNEHKDLARKTIAKDLSEAEFSLYLYECNRQGIHPLDRMLIPIKRNDTEAGEKRLTFITTIDLFRSRAADSGDYAGNEDPTFDYLDGATNPQSATVIVWKMVQGQKCPFTATARWKEYYPGDKQGFMWRAKPHVMLGKCAEALALRKAFPKQLAGLFVAEELERPDDAEPEREPIQPSRRKAEPKQEVLPPTPDLPGIPLSFTDVEYISQKQLNRLLAIQGSAQMPDDTLKEWLKKRGINSRKLIPKGLYEVVVDFIDPEFKFHERPSMEEPF